MTVAVGMNGVHEFCPYKKWLRAYMKDFVLDTILSRSAKGSGLFNNSKINQIADEYWGGKTGAYTDVMTVLDLSLAQQQFRGSL